MRLPVARWLGLLLAAAAGACAASPPLATAYRARPPSVPSGVRYCVYLPPDYSGHPERSYPVLYFLHDAYGDGATVFKKGVIGAIDRRIRSGELPPLLIVSPDGRGTWFSNYHDRRRLYEDFLTRDLPSEIERRYRIRPGRENRAITGTSMGGYAAVRTALHHPDLYGSVSSLSGALIPMAWDDVERLFFFARLTAHRVFGRSPVDNSLADNDVWLLVDRRADWGRPFLQHFRCGRPDRYQLDRVAAQFGTFCNEHGIPTTVVVEPGAHDWDYWREAFPKIVAWHASVWGEI